MSGEPTTHGGVTGKIPDKEIRERAYDLWERHHRPEGFEARFWFMAKRELLAERQAAMASASRSVDDGEG